MAITYLSLIMMQYTYYTLSALGIRVPNRVKRTLTTMQITQFLVGVVYASCHLFVSYTVPVSVAYNLTEKVLTKVSTSSIADVTSSPVTSAVLAPATGVAIAFLKKLVYRAAGDEGLAENVYQQAALAPSPISVAGAAVTTPAQPHVIHDTVNRIVYRTEYEHVPCVDTSGEAFAIYLNLIYLAPLTVLFMRFFFKSYMKRTSPNARNPTNREAISKSAGDAKRGVEHKVESIGKAVEDGLDSAASNVRGRTSKVTTGDSQNKSLSPENKKVLDTIQARVKQELEKNGESLEQTKERAKKFAKEVSSGKNQRTTKGDVDENKAVMNGDHTEDEAVTKEVDVEGKADEETRARVLE
jgi:hypothetical protein